MKKLISILLVAVLILGMFPATVFAAETSETLSIIASKGTLNGKSISWTQNGVTFTNNQGSSSTTIRTSDTDHYRVYASSNVAITAPGNITEIVMTATSASYATVMKNSVGNEATVSGSTITIVPTASADTYTIAKITAQTRINKVVVTYEAGGSTEPDCTHEGTTVLQNVVTGDCTTDSYSGDLVCTACGETVEEGETTTAPGHNYVDGTCEECGAEEPETPAGYALVTSLSELKNDDQVIVVANAKGTYYAMPNTISSKINGQSVSVTNNVIAADNVDNLLWTIGISSNKVTLKSGNNYVKYNSGTNLGSATTAYEWTVTDGVTDNTFRFTSQTSGRGLVFRASTYKQFGGYALSNATAASAEYFDVQLYKMSAGSTEPDVPTCEHTNKTEKTDGYAATCTEEGKTNSVVCNDCGETVTAQETIPALGHHYVDGTCDRENCGVADPFVNLPGRYYIAAIRSSGNYWYMTSDLGEASTKRYQAVDSGLTELPTEITNPEDGYVFVISRNEDGTFCIQAEGVEGDNYLGWTSGNSGALLAAGTAKTKFAAALNEDGTYSFNITEDPTRYLSLNNASGSNYFAWYAGTQVQNLTLIPVVEGAVEPDCEHTNTTAIGEAKEATCTEEGITAGEKCADCDHVIAEQETIAKLPHNYVDGFCSVCEAAEPERYYIAAHRNSEKTHYYMTNDLGDKSTKRYQATAVSGNALPSKVEAAAGYVFILIDNGDGTYSWQAEGIEGNNYLGWTSGNSGALVAEANALKLTMVITEDGYYNFSFQPEGAEKPRYLALNDNTGNNYFAWYEGSQRDLVLIPVKEIAEDETITMTLHGNSENVTVGENQVLDLNGFAATYVTGTNISVYDSTATYTKAADGTVTVDAGTGTLTLTEGSTVVIDNTVDGLRYIALKGEENTYTFHILELKLSAVSLRASAAGIYYKAIMNCDPVLKDAVAYHGMLVSVKNMPGADFRSLSEDGENGWTEIAGAPSEEDFTSCSVFGIFKPGRTDNTARGEMKIYANAYIQLAGTDEIIVADTSYGDKVVNEDGTKNEAFNGIAWSLKDVMQALNTKFDTLDETDQANVVKFYKAWSTAMNPWELGNIVAAATTPAE